MLARMKPILGATAAGSVIGYFGTQNFFFPAMPEPAFAPMIASPLMASVVYMLIVVLFFDWVVQKAGRPMFNAMVIAISQILLVDVNYVMIGRRALEPALVSVVLILVSWAGIAFVYEKLSD